MTLMNSRLLAARAGVMTLVKTALFSVVLLALAAVCVVAQPVEKKGTSTASANVVTDWDEKAVALIQPRMVPPVAYRAMAIVHIAMFDAGNSIEPHYRPYYAQFPATRETSKEAAAAAAAGAVLTKLLPDVASDIQAARMNQTTSGRPGQTR